MKNFLNSNFSDIETCSNPFIFKVNLNLNSDFDATSRFYSFPSTNPNFNCIIGTTYANAAFPAVQVSTMCLDTFFHTSYVSAIADGYEHYSNDEMNKLIFHVARHTVSYLVQLCNSFSSAEELLEQIPGIFKQAGERTLKAFHSSEKNEEAGALVTKVFIEKTMRKVVTGSVGDCLALAWIPQTGELHVLSNPRQYKVHGIFDPIAVSETLSGGMIQSSLHVFPSGTFLIRMTDGAWQSFPFSTHRKYDSEADYDFIEYQIDITFIRKKLLEHQSQIFESTAADYAKFLKNLIIEETERKRGNLLLVNKEIQSYINEKFRDSKTTLKDFYQYIQSTNYDLFEKLTEFLRDFELPIEDLESLSMTQFMERLREGLFMGDDVLISIDKI